MSASAHEKIYRAVFELVNLNPPAAAILDIPCGSGIFAKRLLDAGYQAEAADVRKYIEAPEIPFHAVDMDKTLPFESATFDAVVSIEGIEHIKNPFGFIQECRRIVRPEGRLYLTTPNISSIRSRWRWFLTGFHAKAEYPFDEENPSPRHHINMLAFPALRYMLHTNGFRIETITKNRVKPINWVYAPWAPIHYLATRLAIDHKAKNNAHRGQIVAIRKQMMSTPILFGESIVLVAQRRP